MNGNSPGERPQQPISSAKDSKPDALDTGPPTASAQAQAGPHTASAQAQAGPHTAFVPAPGARPLPDYELVSLLGKGGFGEVWKANGPGGIAVALKFVRLGDDAGTIELRSLELMRDVRHAHLLPLFGCWRRDPYLILALELAERNLLQRLQEAR